IASIKYNENEEPEVALVSIPRDMAVPLGSSNYVKINSIYAYGKMNNPDDDTAGNKMITDYINTISDLPIHYYAQIDFEGFKQIIDSVGGIEVDVKNSFYDSQYPTENFGYQKISFDKGLNEMDGDLALKYARSRHGIVTDGNESEGSDFARAKRQQQILTALKDKAFSVSTVINPKKVNEILSALGNHVRTNMEPWEILRLADIAQNINNEKITNKVIDQESGLLQSTSKSNGYLLMPNDKEYFEIKQVFLHIFNPEKINVEKNEARVAILNGTLIGGLANKNANQLLKEDFEISHTGNASENDYEKTVIYDLTEGEMPDILTNLRGKFDANLSTTNFIEKISKNPIKNIEEIDFIVVLGLDSDI
ncbi:MAG: LCP family protein, partial [Parcubacteria group bacterium]|nr:LCP family protein [Parcubacteria group bacterium]